ILMSSKTQGPRPGSLPAPVLSRRSFVGAAAGTAFTLAFHLPLRGMRAGLEPHTVAPNAFSRIDPQGEVTLVMPQVEMGQGVYTALSMVMADELDTEWSRVKTEHAPPDEKHYANPMIGLQATGNSNSIRAFWMPMRQAGASARACLVEAAASEWRVPPTECRTQDSTVFHDRSGRRRDYG